MSVQQTYSPDKVTVTWGGFDISGFMPQSKVTVSFRTEQTTMKIGCDGQGTYVLSMDESATITIHLSGASLTNAALSAAAKRDRTFHDQVFALQIKDNLGSMLWQAETARIVKVPDRATGADVGDCEWVFGTVKLQGSH